MNSINNGWDSTKREETPYFHRGPSSQKKNDICICIYKHTHGHTNLNNYRYTYLHIHIIQVRFLTLCLKVFKLFALSIDSGKLYKMERPI